MELSEESSKRSKKKFHVNAKNTSNTFCIQVTAESLQNYIERSKFVHWLKKISEDNDQSVGGADSTKHYYKKTFCKTNQNVGGQYIAKYFVLLLLGLDFFISISAPVLIIVYL